VEQRFAQLMGFTYFTCKSCCTTHTKRDTHVRKRKPWSDYWWRWSHGVPVYSHTALVGDRNTWGKPVA